jgi:hypothetical protein
VKLSEAEVRGLNVALNEAVWLGLSLDVEGRRAGATLAVLSLPESGPPHDDRRVQLEERDPVAQWRQPLSLDLWLDPKACAISLDLHHDSDDFLAVRLWFDELRIFTPTWKEIDLAAFIESGKRWWDGLDTGNPRTEGFGIYPLKPFDS